MKKHLSFFAVFLLGVVAALWITNASRFRVVEAQEDRRNAVESVALHDLQTDVAQLKDKASDQAHAMVSVAYHFNNMARRKKSVTLLST